MHAVRVASCVADYYWQNQKSCCLKWSSTSNQGEPNRESAAPSKIFSDCSERLSDPTAHSFKGTWDRLNISSSPPLDITPTHIADKRINRINGCTDTLPTSGSWTWISQGLEFSDSKWNKQPWTHFHWDTRRSGVGSISHLEIKCDAFHFCRFSKSWKSLFIYLFF